ncbi:hypothetical protein K437DRAFT_63121 [Tilletiaria anomala UBC 951]|uniref:PAS domain-containing protein n=1 Tax=Tilletiaria anomala (strain ATCC 24038 / CBS 436.72 / UBC 951) TaxID=1037660 RepID=A0A066V307_TILAU|nr:uncharacterized protein K437DRAFT_63121 [Tilletiaria anomala UBC 951]KDN36092.1 hypothetical protein K437DRAFT_63121 [Tilletiaria anomala UBC 951]
MATFWQPPSHSSSDSSMLLASLPSQPDQLASQRPPKPPKRTSSDTRARNDCDIMPTQSQPSGMPAIGEIDLADAHRPGDMLLGGRKQLEKDEIYRKLYDLKLHSKEALSGSGYESTISRENGVGETSGSQHKDLRALGLNGVASKEDSASSQEDSSIETDETHLRPTPGSTQPQRPTREPKIKPGETARIRERSIGNVDDHETTARFDPNGFALPPMPRDRSLPSYTPSQGMTNESLLAALQLQHQHLLLEQQKNQQLLKEQQVPTSQYHHPQTHSLASGYYGTRNGLAHSPIQQFAPHTPQLPPLPSLFGAPQGLMMRGNSSYASSIKSTSENNNDTTQPHNFPDLHNLPVGAQTSFPNSHVRRDFEFSLKKLMDINVFEELLDDPMGRFRFRQWLQQSRGSATELASLNFATDVRCYEELLRHVRAIALGLHNQYLAPGASCELPVSSMEARAKTLESLRDLLEIRATFDAVSKGLIHDLYHNVWPAFIRTKITEHAKVRLASCVSPQDRGDIGEVFCLTNPRLPDAPIVLCSDGFCKLTGYSREQIIARNCRFLQGPATNPEAIQKLRDALNAAKPCCELLLNYRRDGTPFWNMLSMIPLLSASGEVDYFLGGQIEVSGALSSKSNLGFLIGGASGDENLARTEDGFAEAMGAAALRGEATYELSDEVTAAAARELGVDPTHLAGINVQVRASAGNTRGKKAAGQREDLSGNTVLGPNGAIGSLGSQTPSKSSLSRMKAKLFGSNKHIRAYDNFSQRIGGAETQFTEVLGIDEQMQRFDNVYSNVMVIRRQSRKIIFASPNLLASLGHPTHTPKAQNANSLLNSDFLALISHPWGEKSETKAVREAIRNAIERGVAYSAHVGLKLSKRESKKAAALASSKNARSDDLGNAAAAASLVKQGLIHLTPLKDCHGQAEAYTVLFG